MHFLRKSWSEGKKKKKYQNIHFISILSFQSSGKVITGYQISVIQACQIFVLKQHVAVPAWQKAKLYWATFKQFLFANNGFHKTIATNKSTSCFLFFQLAWILKNY